MYIKDGIADERTTYGEKNVYMWGWLGNKVETAGWDSAEDKKNVLKKLEDIPQNQYCYRTRGFHICEICGMGMGSASIMIKHKGTTFLCPSRVVHYVADHDYKPDDVVVDAILNGKVVG